MPASSLPACLHAHHAPAWGISEVVMLTMLPLSQGITAYQADYGMAAVTVRIEGSPLFQPGQQFNLAMADLGAADGAQALCACSAHSCGVPREPRFCTLCQQGVGDVLDLVFECAALQDLRVRMPMIFMGVTTVRGFMQQRDIR